VRCHLTGIAYTPSDAHLEQAGRVRYVQSHCRWCDAAGHARWERAFNPSNPQIHVHLMRERA
jgi:hypothetical protein